MKIKKAIHLYNEFGFKVAFASFCASAFSHPRAIMFWKQEVLVDYLRKNYGNVIQKYKNLSENDSHESSGIIWSVWWQGEDNAPEIVKKCFANIRKHRGNHEFIIITKENYRDYIDVPEYILKKVDDGIITLTHFSDILRMGLLYKHGGLWLDATIFVMDKIPEEIFETQYYTIRRDIDVDSIFRKSCATFLQAAQKGSKLCSFVFDCHLAFWKDHNDVFDYILIDYIIELACEEFPDIKNLIESVPLNNPNTDYIIPLLNSPFDENKFEELRSTTMFFKLTYKREFEKNISGVPTFYGKIIESDF